CDILQPSRPEPKLQLQQRLLESMTELCAFIFWLAFGFVFYTYLLYPVIIALLARSRAAQEITAPEQWPSIGLIIPVYNEAHNLERKLQNLRAIDYPKDKITFTFIS